MSLLRCSQYILQPQLTLDWLSARKGIVTGQEVMEVLQIK